MEKNVFRKSLAIGIIILFLGAGVVSSKSGSLINNEKKKGIIPLSSEWRYPPDIIVPINYLTIQEAVNNAGQGSCIGVRNGTYNEQISINKNNIILEGELTAPTIILGENTSNSIFVEAINVSVIDFYFNFNASFSTEHENNVIKCITGNNCKFLYNNITGYCYINHTLNGIYGDSSDYLTIYGNSICLNSENIYSMTGIYLKTCRVINISFNKIYRCSIGILLMECPYKRYSQNSVIICNKITQNGGGINVLGRSIVDIYHNEISNNNCGIASVESYPRCIYNNIINNSISLEFLRSIGGIVNNNIVNESADILVQIIYGYFVYAPQNYWGEPSYLSPRHKCFPIFAPIYFFPWSPKPYTIEQCWPD